MSLAFLANIGKSAASLGQKAKFFWRVHGPLIKTVTAVGTGVGATVTACVATTKLEPIIDVHNAELENMKARHEEDPQDYDEKALHKDMRKLYRHTIASIGKLYSLPAALQVASIACSIGSYRQLHAENLAIGAAYVALDKAYKAIKPAPTSEPLRLGDGSRSDEFDVEEEDGAQEGNRVGWAELDDVIHGEEFSPYARWFRPSNINWRNDPLHNEAYFRKCAEIANDWLYSDGHVYLERIYQLMDLELSEAGARVGWVANKWDDDGTPFVGDGKIVITYKPVYLTGAGDDDFPSAYILDFNVDGLIEHIYKHKRY